VSVEEMGEWTTRVPPVGIKAEARQFSGAIRYFFYAHDERKRKNTRLGNLLLRSLGVVIEYRWPGSKRKETP